MAIGNIPAGFTGYAKIGSNTLIIESGSLQAQQNVLFYDHIYGVTDVKGSDGGNGDFFSYKKDGIEQGQYNVKQKFLYRPGPKLYKGTISGPITEDIDVTLFDDAVFARYIDVEIGLTCDGDASYYGSARINQFTITATAGDIVKFSADIIAITHQTKTYQAQERTETKLATWDTASLDGSGISAIQSFSITINNNIKPIYTAGINLDFDMEAVELRAGIQEVTGNISAYMYDGLIEKPVHTIEEPVELTLSIPGFEQTINAIILPHTAAASVGPVIVTYPIVGISNYFDL